MKVMKVRVPRKKDKICKHVHRKISFKMANLIEDENEPMDTYDDTDQVEKMDLTMENLTEDENEPMDTYDDTDQVEKMDLTMENLTEDSDHSMTRERINMKIRVPRERGICKETYRKISSRKLIEVVKKNKLMENLTKDFEKKLVVQDDMEID
ncbi:hypothetical protein QR680_014383 [Steinernema hermaphroditum]|uniref:Uncharacterized protein n=1 Tax=Steinernema hermaphroditum TaxID=289476 RepID=A0AA39IBA1_9BILA|nr:hypothetical protein QR680_014383 [Steinernema hermaphroditum]